MGNEQPSPYDKPALENKKQAPSKDQTNIANEAGDLLTDPAAMAIFHRKTSAPIVNQDTVSSSDSASKDKTVAQPVTGNHDLLAEHDPSKVREMALKDPTLAKALAAADPVFAKLLKQWYPDAAEEQKPKET
jgi:hypothetical protein